MDTFNLIEWMQITNSGPYKKTLLKEAAFGYEENPSDSKLSQYLNVLKSHDFYYTNADGRDYQKGKQQKLELKTLYSELSDDEKQKALEAYKVSFKKYYPVEKYSSNPHYNKIYGNIDDWDINSFDGYK